MEELKKWIEVRIAHLSKSNAQVSYNGETGDYHLGYIDGQIEALHRILFMLEGK